MQFLSFQHVYQLHLFFEPCKISQTRILQGRLLCLLSSTATPLSHPLLHQLLLLLLDYLFSLVLLLFLQVFGLFLPLLLILGHFLLPFLSSPTHHAGAHSSVSPGTWSSGWARRWFSFRPPSPPSAPSRQPVAPLQDTSSIILFRRWLENLAWSNRDLGEFTFCRNCRFMNYCCVRRFKLL